MSADTRYAISSHAVYRRRGDMIRVSPGVVTLFAAFDACAD